MKVSVVYDTKYGNTKLVAEKIENELREVKGIDAAISDVEKVDMDSVADFDAILVGSPNHMGNATRGIRKFIDKLEKLDLEGKWTAVFDTYLSKDFEKAIKKMENQLSKKLPGLKLAAPGLSIRVEGMKGPITEGELPKCKEFGVKIATQLKDQA